MASGEVDLPGGSVDLKMAYYEGVGGAKANLSRSLVSVLPAATPIPPQAANLGTAMVASPLSIGVTRCFDNNCHLLLFSI